MSQSCVVIGAGGHARAVLALLRSANRAQALSPAFVADIAPTGQAEKILGCEVLPLPADLEEVRARGIVSAVIAIGSNHMRRKYFELFEKAGFALPNIIASGAHVDVSAQLGRGNVIGHGVHIGPMVRIGDNNIVNTNANVEHECSVGDHCRLGPGSILCGRVTVEDGCMVGAGSVVLEGMRVAQWVRIGAGAVLTDSAVRAASCYVGVPAREVMGE